MHSLSFKDEQTRVDEWIRQFEEGYWPPLSMLASIMEEVGELAREINDLEGYKKKKKSEIKTSLRLELADIIFSVMCVANYYKIDLEKAFNDIMKKYTQRDKGRWTLKRIQNCSNPKGLLTCHKS
jgi:NTP pyrophosphatase (non-canonical NTP hydrolase)